MLNEFDIALLANKSKTKIIKNPTNGPPKSLYNVISDHLDEVYKANIVDKEAYAEFLREYLTNGLHVYLTK
jgi:hypothetical protein